MKERSQEKRPQIISDLNTNLGTGEITVESLAEKLGINDATLYRWVRNDAEFVEALEIIKEVQKDCIIRSMPHSESGRCRTPNPEHAAH